MSTAPIISIVRPGSLLRPGKTQLVASGVLVDGLTGTSGLFIPWPESALAGQKFGVYLYGRPGQPAQWLTPDRVAVVTIPGQAGLDSLGAVTFSPPPTPSGFYLTTKDTDFYAALQQAISTPQVSWLDALAELDPGFEPLRILAYAANVAPPGPPPPGQTKTPQLDMDITPASARRGSLFCRYVLRND
jgi:hypothetical protein